jgi:hypothetical protein
MDMDNTFMNPNQVNQKEIKDYEAEFDTPITLSEPMRFYIETTTRLGMEILKKYTPIFGDLIGTFITVNTKGDLEVSLQFEKKGAGNVVDLFNNSDFNQRITAFNTLNTTNRIFDLDDTVKGTFQRFLIKANPMQKIDWNQYIRQITINNNTMSGKHTILELAHISLDRLLPELIFVGEDAKKKRTTQIKTIITGSVNPASPLSKNWFVKIDMLDQATVDFVSKEAGIVTSTYGLDMITL